MYDLPYQNVTPMHWHMCSRFCVVSLTLSVIQDVTTICHLMTRTWPSFWNKTIVLTKIFKVCHDGVSKYIESFKIPIDQRNILFLSGFLIIQINGYKPKTYRMKHHPWRILLIILLIYPRLIIIDFPTINFQYQKGKEMTHAWQTIELLYAWYRNNYRHEEYYSSMKIMSLALISSLLLVP